MTELSIQRGMGNMPRGTVGLDREFRTATSQLHVRRQTLYSMTHMGQEELPAMCG